MLLTNSKAALRVVIDDLRLILSQPCLEERLLAGRPESRRGSARNPYLHRVQTQPLEKDDAQDERRGVTSALSDRLVVV